jgi:sugar/nucleoside kinase (ribokinase family)
LLDTGRIDILFANQAEVEALAGVAHLETAVNYVKSKVETLVVTRSENGALATRGAERADVPAEPVEKLVDTTGAGDLFAAGFLFGYAQGKSLEQSLRLGAIAAAEVIQHYGARPEANLRALAGELAAA